MLHSLHGIPHSVSSVKELTSQQKKCSSEPMLMEFTGLTLFLGFPGSACGKEVAGQCIRDTGLIPGSGRSFGGEHGNTLQYSCLENPVDRGSLWAVVRRVAKSLTRLKWLGTAQHSTAHLVSYHPEATGLTKWWNGLLKTKLWFQKTYY